MKLWPSLVLLAACASPAPAPAVTPAAGAVAPPAVRTVKVEGHVLDADGKPLKLAHVVLVDAAKKTLGTTAVAADGAFSLALPETKDRVLELDASGVDHQPTKALLVNNGEGARVDVRLGTYPAQEPPVIALSLRQAKGKSEPPRPMVRQPDGTYLLDLPTTDGAYTYEICGYAQHRCVNGTDGNAFARDSEGDYRSELTVTGGTLHVVFDPKKSFTPGQPSALVFTPPDAMSARLTAIRAQILAEDNDMQEKLHALIAAKKTAPADIMKLSNEGPAAYRAELVKEAATTTGIAWQALAIGYFTYGSFPKPTGEERDRAARIVREVPPGDVLWSFFPDGLSNILEVTPNAAYAEAFVKENPDDTAVGNFLENQLYRAKGDPAALRRLVAVLKAPRFKDTSAATMASMFDPDRPFATGKPMPAFSFASVPDQPGVAAKTITPKTMAGQAYLVEIWATWCGPCVAAMPRLHDLYGKYNRGRIGKKLGVLSVSLDDTAEKVAKFRADKEHPMPWPNAISTEGAIEKLTGVKSIPVPTMVLVDERGIIVGSTPELDEESLPKLLDQLLK